MQLKPIAQQTLVITGASSGIGLATALAAGAAGARVVVAARNEEALKGVVARIEAMGGSAIHVVADVGREEDVRRIAEAAIARFGGFDTWFNNAGVTIFGKSEAVSLEDQRRLFDTNYWGVVHGSLVALEHLRMRGGALINMGSIVSDMVLPLHGPYAASKHAIKAFTDTLRIELRHDDAPVSVTLVKPAVINTPLLAHARNYLPVEPILPPPAYEPEVVAQAVLQAAQHPMRDLVIGEAGPLLIFGRNLMPAVADQVMEATLFRMQQTDQRAGARQDNLHHPTSGGSARGDHPYVLRNSPYTRFISNPGVSSAGQLCTSLLAAPLVLGGKLASSMMGPFLQRSGKRSPVQASDDGQGD